MSNKQPPTPRPSFDYLLNNNEGFMKVMEASRNAIQRACAINSHLLTINGNISVYRQLRDIMKFYGFMYSDQLYCLFKQGKKHVCSTAYDWLLSSYWGLTPDELRALDITQDLSYIKPCIPTGK